MNERYIDMSGVQHELERLATFAKSCNDTVFVFYAREKPEEKGTGTALVLDLNVEARHLIGIVQILAKRYGLSSQDFQNIMAATLAGEVAIGDLERTAWFDENIFNKGDKNHG